MGDIDIDIEVVDGVHVVRMQAGENRLNGQFVEALDEATASVEAAAAPLVLTGEGKFFSNGLDLDWLSGNSAGAEVMFPRLYGIFARLLTFPAPTVTAVNGHAFGAGAILAAAADHRVMREDRGYFCFPEVDLGMVMSPEFDAVLRARYPRRTHLEALATGERYGGPGAVRAGLVDHAVPEGDLLATAITAASAHAGKDGSHVRALKAQIHAPELAVLSSLSRP
ncbi:MAG TPA: enoyl-CoA hydratase/isomerase family protein [Acidimicrobiales bacterium]|nr:enoyl-CoA hydratase/isomerase family protein [Acidimicrobiales bacterium]